MKRSNYWTITEKKTFSEVFLQILPTFNFLDFNFQQANVIISSNKKCFSHIGPKQLICWANPLTGFYIRWTLVGKGLKSITNDHKILLEIVTLFQKFQEMYKIQNMQTCLSRNSWKTFPWIRFLRNTSWNAAEHTWA